MSDHRETSLLQNRFHEESTQVKPADWAQMLEVATQKRTETLMPENLENMWAKGRNYKRQENKIIKSGTQDLSATIPAADSSLPYIKLVQETSVSKPGKFAATEGNSSLLPKHALGSDPLQNFGSTNRSEYSQDPDMQLPHGEEHQVDTVNGIGFPTSNGYKSTLKTFNSASSLVIQPNKEGGSLISEFYTPKIDRHSGGFHGKSSSDMIVRKEEQLVPKLWGPGYWSIF